MNAYILNINYPSLDFIRNEVKTILVDDVVVDLFVNKFISYTIKITKVKTPWANILKQETLSIGADTAVSAGTYRCDTELTDVLLTLTKAQYNRLIEKLEKQYFMKDLRVILINIFKQNKIWKFKNKLYNLKKDFVNIGILNITPDSFSDGGKYNSIDLAIKRVHEMIAEGVDIIDIGGESTKPKAKAISSEEELERITPVIKAINKNFDIPISIDTYKYEVAKEVLNYKISILNDISGGKNIKLLEKQLIETKTGAIIMLNKSDNFTGTDNFKDFDDPMQEYINFVNKQITTLKNINKESLVFDPGIGFSWSQKNTKILLESGYIYQSLPFNTILGISRKSFFQKQLNINLEDRDLASLALSARLIREGVKIFRTHNIKALNIAKKLALY